MVKSLDAATQSAVRARSRVWPCDFVHIIAKDGAGDLVPFGFTTFGTNITTNVIDGDTGDTVSHDYYGDNGPLMDMDPVPLKIGMEIDTTQVVLNILHPVVETMYRGNDIRGAAVQFHRGYLDLDSGLLKAPPRIRRLGFVNRAGEQMAAAGQTSKLTLKVVSVARELTITSQLKWSDASQSLRSGDRMCRYVGNTALVPFWWGEESGSN